ncbi:ABC transporter permease [Natronosalvus rutilus]|uniref:ABC transporter permease n=1 Tax=Natronosalvus rutilus TaxID=2953753 RepID=A0A9E7SYA3_9EURY|nr:ABC transporter permease [Natronosalvus rutilus]
MAASFVLWATFLAGIQHIPNIHQDSHLPSSTLVLMNSMQQSAVFFVPLIGLGLGYNAITGERERGSIKFVLSLPNTRLDVVIGKFVGRTTVLSASVLLAYVLVAGISLVTLDAFSLDIFLRYTLLTLVYGSVYVAVGIGLSAFMKSRQIALIAAACLYMLFLLFWDVFLVFLQFLFVGQELPESGLPEWIQFVAILNPSTAFGYATRWAIPEFNEFVLFPESDAFYLQNRVGVVVLMAWIIIPLCVGYARFRRTTLH